MAQPFIATFRLRWSYIVAGLTHSAHLFCKGVGGSAGSHTIRYRDASDHAAQDVVNALAGVWSRLQVTGSTLPDFSLEQHVGHVWQLIDTITPSYTNHASGTGTDAVQATLVLRDTEYFPIKSVFLEGAFTAPLHYVSVSSMPSGAIATFTEAFTHFSSGADEPFKWVVSRAANYIAGSGDFVGWTSTLNRRIRRDRSLA